MARSNRTRYTVLGTLTHGPRSGYDIKKFIEGSIGNFWRESYGQIYPTLRQLATQGLVTREVAKQKGKPDRYIYAITDAGRAEFREWLAEPAEPEIPRIEILLKLFFGTEMSGEVAVRHIERFRRDLDEGVEGCRRTEELLRTHRKDHPALPFWLLCLRQGILVQRALLEWCDEAEETLRERRQ